MPGAGGAHNGPIARPSPALGPPPAAAIAPLAREIPYADPVALLAVVEGDDHAALLHSASPDARGRCSYLALEPFRVLVARDGVVTADGVPVPGAPLEALRAELARHRIAPVPGLPPFAGGAVGYLGYELGAALEGLPSPPPGPHHVPEMVLMLCDLVVAIDHDARRATILSSGLPETEPAARAARARRRLDHAAARLAAVAPLPPPPAPAAPAPVAAEVTRSAHEAAVRRVIEYILAGDVFQANISQRFTAPLPAPLTPLGLYRRMQAVNPAPFSGYLRLGDLVVASSSPERFLRLDGDRVETRPIKGTRPRGVSPADDDALAAELAASEKDRAENVMIVDLLRNDLSRVCRDESVAVPALCAVERFATVMHLVSTVTGRLREGLGPVDLLEACLPGGSITGAPKIRAMEIIAELEGTRRGAYCGAMGWIGFDGALDTSIVIRTCTVRDGTVAFSAGGGVVADSDPAAEYEETLDKARGMFAALAP